MASVLLFTSCVGAGVGGVLGGALGSAIGGISGGPRGSDIGMLVGAMGGAMVGAAIEANADQQAANQQAADQQQYQAEKARLAANREARQNMNYTPVDSYNYSTDDSGFDPTNSGDDRVDIDFGDGSNVEAVPFDNLEASTRAPKIEIHNIRFSDSNNTNTIERGELCQISFEIYNAGDATAYDIEPSVVETANNGRIQVSPSILIESLAAHKGVRYTARLGAKSSLKNGMANFTITCTVDGQPTGEGATFSVPTTKN